jgi:hypothetical protein
MDVYLETLIIRALTRGQIRAVRDAALGDAKLFVRNGQCEPKLPGSEKGLGILLARRGVRL